MSFIITMGGKIPELSRLHLFNETALKQELETRERINAECSVELEAHERRGSLNMQG